MGSILQGEKGDGGRWVVGGGGSPRETNRASVISEGVELPETAALITNTALMSLGRGVGLQCRQGWGSLD